MKFWAKVAVWEESDASHLIRAFFQDFNPESSINIKGHEARIEAFFDSTPPMNLVNAISNCVVSEFYYGKTLGEFVEGEINQVTAVTEPDTPEVLEEPEAPEAPEESTELTESAEPVEDAEHSDSVVSGKNNGGKVFQGRRSFSETEEIVNKLVPLLEEHASKAESFHHFVNLVGEWLKIKKRLAYFEAVSIAATTVDKISWKNLEEKLDSANFVYSNWDKISTNRYISKFFNDPTISLLPLLTAMVKYIDYPFTVAQVEEESLSQQVVLDTTVLDIDGSINTQQEVLDIDEPILTQQTVGTIDQTLPVETRVKSVLTAMGLEEANSEDQMLILNIANTAVQLKEADIESVYASAGVPEDFEKEARMILSTFVNNFVNKALPHHKEVSSFEFLKELQKVVADDNSFAEQG